MTSAGQGAADARQAEDILRVFDAIPTLAWSARSDGSADFFNRRWLDYTGLSVEQARDWGWTVALHPDDLKGLVDYWRSVLASLEAGEIEGRLRRFDGVYRWFLFRATPSFDHDGAVVKWVGTNTDIEDRKLAEEALRATERHLRLIVDTIPGFVCTLSAAGEVEHLNRQTLEYFGKTSEDLKGWATSDAVHPDDLPRVIAAFTHSITTGTPYDIEHRCRRADGVYRWFQVRALPVRDTADRITSWYVLLTDIDDRKRAEDAIRARQRDLSSIINTIPMLAWSARPDGFCDFLNQRWLDFTGLSTEQARGWGWGAAIHPDDAKGLLDSWQMALVTGHLADVEVRMRRFDGEYRWFLLRASPLRD